MNLNELVDQVFVVNLDKHTERMEQTRQELQNFSIAFERFPACSPNGGLNYVDRVAGCRQSHIEIIKIAKQRNLKRICVFEDDVELNPAFNKRLSVVKEFLDKTPCDIFYFGGSHFNNQHTLVEQNISRVTSTFTTHAYIMDSSIFDFVLERENLPMPIDDIYVKQIQNLGKCYCIRPNIAYQRVGMATISLKYSDYKWIREEQ